MTSRLRIAIATAGRFHVLDLARELDALGHDVRFYSYVPKARARRFGLSDERQTPLLPFVAPAVAWERLAPRLAPALRERLLYFLLNRAVMLRLSPCDVFICMSGIYLEAARYAKRRFGARIWLERGSRHILSQDEILAAIPGARRPGDYVIKRELAGYALADRIVIPSAHVAESFRSDDPAFAKLFHNPYGVDLAMFPCGRQPASDRTAFTLMFAGNWSLQKGCDVLAAAVSRLPDVQLVHVGALGDLDFPKSPQFKHFDHVPQTELSRFYAAADVFVLASRQDGLSMVQSQALASGLPLICTDRTGGADLAHTPTLAARIRVIPSDDVDVLVGAICAVRAKLCGQEPLPPLTEDDRQTLAWAAYARRYSDELSRDLAGA